MDKSRQSYRAGLEGALSRMTAALELLDSIDAPSDVGAHLDLAINRLEEESAKLTSDVDIRTIQKL